MSISRQVSIMSAAKPDRRVQRTRQLLRDSLIALILDKGYDAVTIQDITDHANLGRATFYLHYRDKEDLLISSLQETFDELVNKIEPAISADLTSSPAALVAFEHAAQNRDLYRVMLSGQGATVLARRIRTFLVNLLQERIRLMAGSRPLPVPIDILANHMAGSLLALLSLWIEEDMGYSAEDMAHAYQQLNWHALFALVRESPVESEGI
jgi:AcrR family transcriptional regulator